MSGKIGTSTTLDLLAQYDNHISERDKAIDDIEKKPELEDNRLPYDELFKENVKLKLELKEYRHDIISLKKVINLMQKDKNSSLDDLINQVKAATIDSPDLKKGIVLPPRSTERSGNIKDLASRTTSPISSGRDNIIKSPSTAQDDTQEVGSNMNSSSSIETAQVIKVNDNIITNNASNITSNYLLPSQTPSLSSPAASVTYTTSRITIKSPNKSQRSSIPQDKLNSPQTINRVTSVINNHLHSPLKNSNDDERDVDLSERSSRYSQMDSNFERSAEYIPSRSPNREIDFSPNAKAKLNNFSQLLADSFGEEANAMSQQKAPENIDTNRPLPPAPPSFFTPQGPTATSSPGGAKLGSPVILNRNRNYNNNIGTNDQPMGQEYGNKATGSIDDKLLGSPSVNTQANSMSNTAVPTINSLSRLSPTTEVTSNDNSLRVNNNPRANRADSTATVQSNPTSMLTSDIPLFVQPDDFGTIRMEILSTLYIDPHSVSEVQLILFAVIDRNSNKEMFKFSKSIQKIRELDVYLKSHISTISLPHLPGRSLFETTIPVKVDQRRELLNSYFCAMFNIPEFPKNVSLKIAQFMSTDTVTSPFLLEETVKEGYLLMRRPKKALGGNVSWKPRYGILNSDYLQLIDGDETTESIRLRQATLELLPNLPDDRYGTKNGFLLTEQKKGGLSTASRYYICTETPKERETWISSISRFIDSSKNISLASPDNAINLSNSSMNDSTDQMYVTDLTQGDSNSNGIDSFQSTSYDQFEGSSNNMDEEKDSKRNKKRSLFPFKKFSAMTNNTLHSNSGAHNNNHNDVIDNAGVEKYSWNEADTSGSAVAQGFVPSPIFKSNTVSHDVVFGSSINNCLKLSSHSYQGVYNIPSVVYRCLEYLYKNHGIQEEGIFRLSGSSTLIKTLQEEFDRDCDIDLCNYRGGEQNGANYIGVNTISGLLKLYLRKLPHLIVGDEQFLLFKKVVDDHHNDPTSIAVEFRKLIQDNQVPHANVSLMFSLFELLTRINENSKYNKMNLRNLCIVFSPTLNIPIAMLQPFIVDFNCIFKGEEPVSSDKREELDIHIPGV